MNRTVHRSSGAERLFSARLVVLSTVPASGSNYWTFTLRHRRIVAGTLQTYGELVGAAYSTATRTLSPGDPVDLYDDLAGLPMQEGELLVLTIISTGSPTVLDDPRLNLDVRDQVR